MEGIFDLGADAEELSGVWSVDVKKVVVGTGETLLGPVLWGREHACL